MLLFLTFIHPRLQLSHGVVELLRLGVIFCFTAHFFELVFHILKLVLTVLYVLFDWFLRAPPPALLFEVVGAIRLDLGQFLYHFLKALGSARFTRRSCALLSGYL